MSIFAERINFKQNRLNVVHCSTVMQSLTHNNEKMLNTAHLVAIVINECVQNRFDIVFCLTIARCDCFIASYFGGPLLITLANILQLLDKQHPNTHTHILMLFETLFRTSVCEY